MNDVDRTDTYVETSEGMLQTGLRRVYALPVAIVQKYAAHNAPLCKFLEELADLQELSAPKAQISGSTLERKKMESFTYSCNRHTLSWKGSSTERSLSMSYVSAIA